MKEIEIILEELSGIIWGNYLIITLIGVGLFFTIITGGIQIKGFPLAIKELVNSLRGKNEIKGEGTLSAFQALCTALSSCVGNGNIVGVATAIASGGPGAVFWMWFAGIVGMATKYAEIVLGIIYREKSDDGTYVGGPMYYLSKGLGWKKIATLFSILMFLQISGGALIQSNAVAIVIKDMFKIKPIFSGIMMAGVITAVVIGGVRRLGKVAERIIPVMTITYFIGGLIIIISNFNHISYAIINIITCAFNTEAVGGGVLGYTIKEAMRFGVARGLYSNEAGEGSAPVLHSAAITDHPARQGLYGILEVFIDTVVICSLTAFIVLTSGVMEMNVSPAVYVITAFGTIHPMFRYVVGISMVLFAFSTILSQWYFGNVTLTYIFNSKVASYFKYVFVCLAIMGSLSSLKIVWLIQDIVLGLMIIPNLIGLLLLNGKVKDATKDFWNMINRGEIKKYVSK
ncbi:sodium:alanine symporter family protein [Fusobacterium ulcerans]|jgi:AGCS family alanine or glycine:cation symporter|uniref:Na+/alanine symporter n=2 Tax=Fusobacterium ulcerans TaxID=861 RepID=A0AAX2JGI3_9FUSO|nr:MULTISPECIES: amino acid carrier protein [Fusobacterium]AVQ27853.1 sodium:alanine symporter family protein [Fusobacterium ulcerans]EFS27443.1 amino acid carrier protein [Fusobacterium ulcerans ATCC 49185]EHO77726.1 amino acid carrier protein [Fusobacterium ulcerans 12-1B]MCB8565336.1 amino acid carrier protein [Fusobacterium ulcerans]MCB8649364.1 amino acid carrier protein [Fusobacterium ulcerans]